MSLIEKELITEIADQLRIPAEQIFRIVVEAQPMIGFLNITSLVLSTFLLLYILKRSHVWLKKEESTIENTSYTLIFVGIVGGLIIFFIIAFLFDSMRIILLPEYSAIIEVMRWFN